MRGGGLAAGGQGNSLAVSLSGGPTAAVSKGRRPSRAEGCAGSPAGRSSLAGFVADPGGYRATPGGLVRPGGRGQTHRTKNKVGPGADKRKNPDVYYSQPTRYAFDYTTDVHAIGDDPIVYGYPTRLNARNLYEL